MMLFIARRGRNGSIYRQKRQCEAIYRQERQERCYLKGGRVRDDVIYRSKRQEGCYLYFSTWCTTNYIADSFFAIYTYWQMYTIQCFVISTLSLRSWFNVNFILSWKRINIRLWLVSESFYLFCVLAFYFVSCIICVYCIWCLSK